MSDSITLFSNKEEQEIYDATVKLNNAIYEGKTDVYYEMTDKKLSCIESETNFQIVLGQDFHKFYMDRLHERNIVIQVSVAQPVIKVKGEMGYIAYIRILQVYNPETKEFKSITSSETRIWEKQNNSWKMIHFHRTNHK